MKLSEASPPHPWNPELPRFSQAVDHLPAILGMWNKFRSCISLSLSVLRGAGHAESVFAVFPLLPPAGSGRFTCGGGRISVPRAGATRKEVESKKAVKTDPGGMTPAFGWSNPISGSGSDLTAFTCMAFHCLAGCDCAMKSQQLSTTLMKE